MNRSDNSRRARAEIQGLPALRHAAGRTQSEIAAALRIKQPSVSKMEAQDDMLLSTLRGYVRAMGGEVEVVVRLPGQRAVRLAGLGEPAAPRKRPKGRGRDRVR